MQPQRALALLGPSCCCCFACCFCTLGNSKWFHLCTASDGQEIAEPASHGCPHRVDWSRRLERSWPPFMGWGAALEGVLIITLKCICLIKHIRDKILKGQIPFSEKMSFSASVFYWNNNPDKIRVTFELLPGEVDERKSIFVFTTNSAPMRRRQPYSTFTGAS